MTARESILEYLVTLMTQVPNATAFRSREEALARTEGPAIIVKPKNEPVENRAGGGSMGLVLRNFSVVIEVLVRGQPGGMSADQISDPFVLAAHRFLMADTTLGGLAATVIEEETEWDFEVADGTALAVTTVYIVRYQTRAGSLVLG